MVFRKPRERTIKARALTDPKPAFVSIVTAGANQAPFRSVKLDAAGDTVHDIHERIKAMKIQGQEVARVEFKTGEEFPDETAVRAWLEEGGYPVDSLKEVEDGFMIENDEAEFEEGSVVQIDTPDGAGITVWVGKLAEAEGATKDATGDDTTDRATVRDVEIVGKKDDAVEEARTGKEDNESGGNEDVAKGAHLKAKPKRKVTTQRQKDREARSTTLDPVLPEVEGRKDDRHTVVDTILRGSDEDVSAKGEEADAPDEFEGVEKSEIEDAQKTVIGWASAHKGGTPAAARDAEWSAGAERRKASVEDLLVMSAWREDKAKADLVKGDFKFPHHKAAGQHATVFRGVTAAIGAINGARGGSSIPSNERRGVYNHLARHVREDFDEEPAEFKAQAEYEEDLAISAEVYEVAETKRAYMDDETAKRFDEFMAHFSEAMTMGGVIADANDGIPAGFGEAVQAMVVAMRNNILADQVNNVKAVAAEFGELIVALANAFSGSEDTDRAAKMLDLFGSRLPEDASAPQADAAEEEEDETTSQDEDEGSAGEAAAKDADEAEGEGESPVLRAIGELAKTVAVNQTKTDEAIAQVKQDVAATRKKVDETEAGLTSRVKELEDERQTRKSADEDGDDDSTTVTKSPLADLKLRSALGISTTPPISGW